MQHVNMQWHNKRMEWHDNFIVTQLTLFFEQVYGPHLHPPLPGPAHQYHLPSSNLGQAQVKVKTVAAVVALLIRPLIQYSAISCLLHLHLSAGDADTSNRSDLFLSLPLQWSTTAPAHNLTRKVVHDVELMRAIQDTLDTANIKVWFTALLWRLWPRKPWPACESLSLIQVWVERPTMP